MVIGSWDRTIDLVVYSKRTKRTKRTKESEFHRIDFDVLSGHRSILPGQMKAVAVTPAKASPIHPPQPAIHPFLPFPLLLLALLGVGKGSVPDRPVGGEGVLAAGGLGDSQDKPGAAGLCE